MIKKLRVDLHVHSIASSHAFGTVGEILSYADEIGMEGIAVTDHCPGIDNTVWLCKQPETKKRLDRQIRGPDGAYFSTFISRYTKSDKISPTLFKGIECNILGSGVDPVDVPDFLASEFDIVIASLHDLSHLFVVESREQVTERMILAMSGPVDIIGHPFHKKCCPFMEPLVAAAADTGMVLELNNSSIRQGKGDMEEVTLMLNLAKEKRCRISVSSDAHVINEIADITEAASLLDSIDFPEELIVNRDLASTRQFVEMCRQKRKREY